MPPSPAPRYQPVKQSEWDFKLALFLVTIAAFVTRFWGIKHPNQVVFDEVHFGKVTPLRYPCPFRAHSPILVRLVLPTAHLLLRCPPSFWKTPLRLRRMARRLPRRVSFRQHWRFIHLQQGSICRIPLSSRPVGGLDRPYRLLDHVGVWLLAPFVPGCHRHRPLRQRPRRPNPSDSARRHSHLLHGPECAMLRPLLQAAPYSIHP